MPHNYSGRITTILLVLLAATWAIFPSLFKAPLRLLDSSVPFSQKHDLKPGIDMVGGTSLLYEIKQPEGGSNIPNLAEQVMESLKKRVDPDGVRNLIWRPSGETRLEIQMPLSNKSEQAGEFREAFSQAQEQLESTNIRPAEVIRAVEKLSGDQRRERLAKLDMGSAARQKLFGALASVSDQIQQAKEQQNARLQAEKELEYEKLQAQIDDTNLTSLELENILSLKPEARGKRLAELKKQYADFPARLAAIDAFEKAYANYTIVRGTLDDAADLKRLLRGSGVLEFHILVEDLAVPEATALIERLKAKGPAFQAGDTMRWYEVDQPEEFGHATFPYGGRFYVLAYVTPEQSMTNRGGAERWALKRAYPVQDPGQVVVGFSFDPEGARLFGELTTNNVRRPLAIMLDDKVISAPNINEPITQGSGVINGGADGFSQQELSYLIKTLNAGSLPAQLADEPISERTVGPQLGEDNLRRGLMACVFGLIVVAVFLIGYYYIAGVVATIAVMMNMVLILGGMAMLNATFTLAGIAGIVLTIGMAVDANVLIFERLREEQVRGLSLRMALRNAYDRAFSAILDSNVTTGITALVLYWFGSEEVKGFGITLLIGLLSSLFTALFVTRTIFGLLIDKFGLTRLGSLPLTFPKWDKMLRPNVDWMGKAWIFYVFSIVFITTGLAAFGYKLYQGQMLDIEFASGTSVQFELKNPMPIGEVRSLIDQGDKQALPSPSVVSVGNDDLVYEVVTPNQTAADVKRAVLDALGERLKLELPSSFEQVGQPLEAAVGQTVLPIESDSIAVDGFNPPSADAHVGGVAIVLKGLNPALTPKEIADRIERQRLQPQAGQAAPTYRDFTVEAETGPDQPTRTAVVLVSDPAFPYEQDVTKWRDELARPMWSLVNEAINQPAELQKVSNFDAQVAGETQRDASIALVLSVIFIMAYIWVRFGNLKYGTATVIALVHDTLFTIAAVGLAHVIGGTPIGNALLIEPFRINLTLVAAILTVMGYSMNDTVVVFDRIRENRGKLGHVNRQVVNDSINQTLSRTLLTGGTTIVTIFVMYVWGGPGIHGFTFALLVGILVGTYSSIAIASPFLLVGGAEESAGAARKTPAGQLQRA